jgi:cell division protein FtsI/penicillin-binding protein 2
MKQITDAKEQVVCQSKATAQQRIVSARSAQVITRMLQQVVTEDGTGEKAAITGYAVAGKTGTSQKTHGGRRGYAEKKLIASFAGYAPASHPRICAVVIIDEPQDVYYGGTVAAPVFQRLARFALNYLHVPPKRHQQSTSPWRETKIRHRNKNQG